MRAISRILLLALLFSLGCGIHSENRAPLLGNRLGTIAFQDYVHPVLSRNCGSCHKNSQFPFFASGNVQKSYDTSKRYVDFEEVKISTLAQRSADGHCGLVCTGQSRHKIEQAIEKWWEEGEVFSSASQYGTILSAKSIKSLKTPESLEDNFLKLSWDLGEEAGPEFNGATFSILVTWFDEASYLVKSPTLTTGENVLRVADIKVLLNGRYSTQNATYTRLTKVVPANSTLELNGGQMVMAQKRGYESDKIAIAMGTLRVGGCKNLPLFTETVYPIFQAKCAGCHGATSRGGFRTVGVPEEEACAVSLDRIDSTNPENSSLIKFPLLGDPMNTTPKINQAEADVFLEWIRTELAP